MKVLIAEDEPVSRRLLERFLRKWGYDVLVTCDGSEAWEALQETDSPNLVVSDWMMPEMDGLELCRKIRGMDRSGYIYFILLTAKGRKNDVIQGLEAGADDFLVKPFDKEELQYRIRIGERIIELERRILDLAATDSLTGVLNRRAFMERLEQEIERSRRGNTSLSLIMADIDYFKKVNDSIKANSRINRILSDSDAATEILFQLCQCFIKVGVFMLQVVDCKHNRLFSFSSMSPGYFSTYLNTILSVYDHNSCVGNIK